jgi:hypothetical protein
VAGEDCRSPFIENQLNRRERGSNTAIIRDRSIVVGGNVEIDTDEDLFAGDINVSDRLLCHDLSAPCQSLTSESSLFELSEFASV